MTSVTSRSAFPSPSTTTGVYPTVSFLGTDLFRKRWPVEVVAVASGTTTLRYAPYGSDGCYTQAQISGPVTDCRPNTPDFNTQTWLVAPPNYVEQRFGTSSSLVGGRMTTGPFSYRLECATMSTSSRASCLTTLSYPPRPLTTELETEIRKNTVSLDPDSPNESASGWDYITLYVTRGAELLGTDRSRTGMLTGTDLLPIETSTTSSTASAPSATSASTSSNYGPALHHTGAPGAGMWALGLTALFILVPAVTL